MNIWNDIEAQYFFSKERQKKNDLYLGENFFLSKLLFEKCSILDIGCAQGGFYKILNDSFAIILDLVKTEKIQVEM